MARLEVELSTFEKDPKKMIEEAVSHSERGLQLCVKHALYAEKIGHLSLYSELGLNQYFCAGLMSRLYWLTHDDEHLRKAMRFFKEAAESYLKVNLVSRVAECHWKVAQILDTLEENLQATENFRLASNSYKRAADRIPQLREFYQDHALYMQAWEEIEKAKHYHRRQEYGPAMESFKKAAIIHESSKRWNYITPNYLAWSKIEEGEDLSRKEQGEEAITAFEQAAELFTEAGKSLQAQLDKIEDADEKQMIAKMVKAATPRSEYCSARMDLEEARILNKKGDHYASRERYGSSIEALDRIIQSLELEQDKKEVRYIASLSRAWQKMTQAEAEASPALYREAAQLFEEAKELAAIEKTKMLAMGHSRFCRALETGTKFADTRDVTLHRVVIQHLESALGYYLRADSRSASEYTRATRLSYDAYVHMSNAATESEPEKKARLYMLAEKVLQVSADAFEKAGDPSKKNQILRLNETVKREREFAISLSEVLHAPTMVSAAAFSSLSPTREEAVGVERFEHPGVEANLAVSAERLEVGEDLDLRIELANPGKGPALLKHISGIIPEGFELSARSITYRKEGNGINLRGRRLDPLKTEEIELTIRPKSKGEFRIEPSVSYIDEKGNTKSHMIEPVKITVQESGIKGWLKGER